MVIQIWVNIGSGIGLLPDGTKPLPEAIMPLLTYHQRCSVAFTSTENSQKLLNLILHNMICSEITLLWLLPHLPGVNELINWEMLRYIISMGTILSVSNLQNKSSHYHIRPGQPVCINELWSSLVQVMAWYLSSTKPSPERIMGYCWLDQ